MSNRLDDYLEKWHLTDAQPLATTVTSYVYTTTYEGERVVLKLLTDIGAEERQGAIALRYFDGNGAVHLLREDEHAHLLEYADGENLVGMVREAADEQATAIIGDVLNQLHKPSKLPIPEHVTPLTVWFRGLFNQAILDRSKDLDSIYVRAARLAEQLLGQQREVRVLHGDIHHENIRHHATRGWLAFDPKGLVGERTFDAANTFCNPMNMAKVVENETRILSTSSILAEKMGIEQTRILAFVYIYACLSASWIVGDGQNASHELTIAGLIEPHIARVSF